MKEIDTHELERLKSFLAFGLDERPRNLNPFFDVKLFELENLLQTCDIIKHAYSKARPVEDRIFARSLNDFSDGILGFFSEIENTNPQRQVEAAFEFIDLLESCMNLEKSKIGEYVPDESGFDELFDFITMGFTYIIVDEEALRSLIIHGGDCD